MADINLVDVADVKYEVPDDEVPWFPGEIDPLCTDSENCTVCGSEIIVGESYSNEQFSLPSNGLNLLSNIFQISTTIHNQLGIDTLDKLIDQEKEQEEIRIFLYCSNCVTAIRESLRLAQQIEELQKSLSTVKNSLKKSLIQTFNDETGREDRDNVGNSQTKWRTELDAAKKRIRKSYAQFWTPCNVRLKNSFVSPSLKTVLPIPFSSISDNGVVKSIKNRSILLNINSCSSGVPIVADIHVKSLTIQEKVQDFSAKRMRDILRIKKYRQKGNFRYSCELCGKGYNQLKPFIIHQDCHQYQLANKARKNAAKEAASTQDSPLDKDANDIDPSNDSPKKPRRRVKQKSLSALNVQSDSPNRQTRGKAREESDPALNTQPATDIIEQSSIATLLTDSVLPSQADVSGGCFGEIIIATESESSSSDSDCGSLYSPDSPDAITNCDEINDEDAGAAEVTENKDDNIPSQSEVDTAASQERRRWVTERGILTITRNLQIRKNYRYECDVCGKRYSVKHRFDMHVLCHKGEWDPGDPRFSVKVKPKFRVRNSRAQILARNTRKVKAFNEKRFRDIFRIKDHRQKGSLPYRCKLCGKGYRQLKPFKVHQDCHKQAAKVMEEMANVALGDQDAALKAYKSGGTVTPVITSVCSTASGSVNATEGEAGTTFETMSGPPYDCKICRRSFKYPKSFENHCKNHGLEVNDASANVEVKTGVGNDGLRKRRTLPEVREYPYRCAVCDKGYFVQDYLYMHEQTYHQNPEEGDGSGTSEAKFPCTKCDARFTNAKYLNFHDLKMHRYPFERVHNQVGHLISFKCGWCSKVFDKVNYMTESGEWNFTCPKVGCTKRTSNFISFSWHHGGCCDDKVPHPGADQLYQCEYCGKQCKTAANLESHRISLHTKEYPHLCFKCGMGFSTKSGLKAHISSVHDEEGHRFKCETCKKTFKTKRLYVHHIKMHNNDRRFVCATCGKGFVAMITLKNHEATHTAVKDTPCPICHKMFANKGYVWEHIYSIHERRRPPRKKKPGPKRRKVPPPKDSDNDTLSMEAFELVQDDSQM